MLRQANAPVLVPVLPPSQDDPAFAAWIGSRCQRVAGVALARGAAGSLARIGGDRAGRMRAVRRIAPVCLSVVAFDVVAGIRGA